MIRSSSTFLPLTPEQQLLLQGLQTYLPMCGQATGGSSPGIGLQRRSILSAQDIDWLQFWHLVQQHDLLPTILDAMHVGCIQAVPSAFFEQAKPICCRMTIGNLYLTQVLLSTLEELQGSGIKVIPFKGAVLALNGYGGLNRRNFCDLDLLVHQADFEATKQQLMHQGYEVNIDANWSVHLIHPQTQVNIDLHHQISEVYFPFVLSFHDLFQRSQRQQYVHYTFQVLSPEDSLIIQCIQLAKDAHHQQKFLKKVCDVAVLIHHTPIQWEQAIAYADAMHGKRLVLFSLYLTQQLLNVNIPDWIQEEIEKDWVLKVYGQSVCQRLFTEEGFERGSKGMLLRALFLIEKPLNLQSRNKELFQHILTVTAAKLRRSKRGKSEL